MASYDLDPPEFTGTEQTIAADHKGKRAVAAPVVAPAVPSPKPGTHPKHAIERPRREHEAAQQETRDAQTELMLSNNALRLADLAEENALAAWISLQPKPDTDKLLHDYANAQAQQRAANVAQGHPPGGLRPQEHNRSPVDIAAVNRPRSTPQAPNAPLRSATVRRAV